MSAITGRTTVRRLGVRQCWIHEHDRILNRARYFSTQTEEQPFQTAKTPCRPYLEEMNSKMAECLDAASTKRIHPEITLKKILDLKALLQKSDESPNSKTYESILSAYTRLSNIDKVTALLPEMLAQNILPSRTFFHNTLNFLSQYGRVTEQRRLLEVMESIGMERTSQTYVFLLMGMEHNRELERALDTIKMMRIEGIQPSQSALLSIVKMAVLFRTVDEAHEVLNEAEKTNQEMPQLPYMCLQLLRGAALQSNYKVVKARWRVVMDKKLEPDDGLCRLALGVAAGAGDAELASDIMKVVGDLGYAYHESHFVALVEAYARKVDIGSTFQVLNLMRRAGIVPGKRVAAPIVRMLGSNTDAVNEACAAIKQMAAQSLPVDVAALNAVIHAFAYNGENDKAIELYESAAELHITPNIETIDAVLDACIHSKRADYGRTLHKKLVENDVLELPTHTLSKLVVLECTQDDYSLALDHLQQMRDRNMVPLMGCYYVVIKTLAAAQDSRLWAVIAEMKSHGYKLSSHVKIYISTHMPNTYPEPESKAHNSFQNA